MKFLTDKRKVRRLCYQKLKLNKKYTKKFGFEEGMNTCKKILHKIIRETK
jgi:hypothetical protein